MNADVALIYIICSSWVKNLNMSTLAFNIAQFFSSLNHQFLVLILKKAGFDPCVAKFFSNYFIGRKINYFWNSFTLSSFDINIGVGQGLALSPILLVLYFLLFLHIIENCLKNLKIPISILSFVDNGLFIF